MSFDRSALISACAAHGQVARVVVARVRGSAPREVGAAMLVWQDGFSGTIGGGTLEHEAMAAARAQLDTKTAKLSRRALGPDLGQCCGGAVDLFTDVFDHASAQALPDGLILRGAGDMPLGVARVKAAFDSHGHVPLPQMIDGWMVEPVHQPTRTLWVWGAGHVGRAVVDVISPLPDVATTWVDTDSARFPGQVAPHINPIAAAHPARLVPYAPRDAEHLILTYSHDLDLELCHQLLRHGFRYAGLIGSATKWARFRSRLAALGHSPEAISRITCPIGNPEHGKHPQAIAIGVAEAFLRSDHMALDMKGTA